MSDDEPLTRREARRRAAEPEPTEWDALPDVATVVAGVRAAREAREQNENNPFNFDPEFHDATAAIERTQFLDEDYRYEPVRALPDPRKEDEDIRIASEAEKARRTIEAQAKLVRPTDGTPTGEIASSSYSVETRSVPIKRMVGRKIVTEMMEIPVAHSYAGQDREDDPDDQWTDAVRDQERSARGHTERESSRTGIAAIWPKRNGKSTQVTQDEEDYQDRLTEEDRRVTEEADRAAGEAADEDTQPSYRHNEGFPPEVLEEITRNAHGTKTTPAEDYNTGPLPWPGKRTEPTDPDWTPDDAPEPSVKSLAWLEAQKAEANDPKGPATGAATGPATVDLWGPEIWKDGEQPPRRTAIERLTRRHKPKNPGSRSASQPELGAKARNHAVRVVSDRHIVSSSRLATTILYIVAILLGALTVYGVTGLFYAVNAGNNPGRDLVYVVAPAAIAIVCIFGALEITRAKEESEY